MFIWCGTWLGLYDSDNYIAIIKPICLVVLTSWYKINRDVGMHLRIKTFSSHGLATIFQGQRSRNAYNFILLGTFVFGSTVYLHIIRRCFCDRPVNFFIMMVSETLVNYTCMHQSTFNIMLFIKFYLMTSNSNF